MSEQSKQKALDAVKNAISTLANVEAEDINATDHLEDDLFLTSRDIPKIFSEVSVELDLDMDPDTISDFIEEVSDEPEKATVAMLSQIVQEVIDFS